MFSKEPRKPGLKRFRAESFDVIRKLGESLRKHIKGSTISSTFGRVANNSREISINCYFPRSVISQGDPTISYTENNATPGKYGGEV